MLKNIKGIIISEVKYGETSTIINILTNNNEIVGAYAKGSRTLKSKLRSSTSKLTYVDLIISSISKDKLSIIKESNVINYYSNIKIF